MKKYQYEVRTSVFHGDHHLGYSNSLERAIRLAKKHNMPDCACGRCAVIYRDGEPLGEDEVAYLAYKYDY